MDAINIIAQAGMAFLQAFGVVGLVKGFIAALAGLIVIGSGIAVFRRAAH